MNIIHYKICNTSYYVTLYMCALTCPINIVFFHDSRNLNYASKMCVQHVDERTTHNYMENWIPIR